MQPAPDNSGITNQDTALCQAAQSARLNPRPAARCRSPIAGDSNPTGGVVKVGAAGVLDGGGPPTAVRVSTLSRRSAEVPGVLDADLGLAAGEALGAAQAAGRLLRLNVCLSQRLERGVRVRVVPDGDPLQLPAEV
jgi:hypothetical protein